MKFYPAAGIRGAAALGQKGAGVSDREFAATIGYHHRFAGKICRRSPSRRGILVRFCFYDVKFSAVCGKFATT
jgi:hypothetical protein